MPIWEQWSRAASLSLLGQKAIIAFYGSKEILILQTDWKAGRSAVSD